jgi:hypothetical protein
MMKTARASEKNDFMLVPSDAEKAYPDSANLASDTPCARRLVTGAGNTA